MSGLGFVRKLWPGESFQIETAMTLDEVVRTFSEHVDQTKFFKLSLRRTKFVGRVTREGFRLIPHIRFFYNSFSMPVIHGQFRERASGTVISVRISLFLPIAIFMAIFFVGGVAWLLASLLGLLASPGSATLCILALVVGWVVMTLSFRYEVAKTRMILLTIARPSGCGKGRT